MITLIFFLTDKISSKDRFFLHVRNCFSDSRCGNYHNYWLLLFLFSTFIHNRPANLCNVIAKAMSINHKLLWHRPKN